MSTDANDPSEATTRAAELLPWFVNGTLPMHVRREVAAVIVTDPALDADLYWLHEVKRAARATGSSPNLERGRERLLQSLDAASTEPKV